MFGKRGVRYIFESRQENIDILILYGFKIQFIPARHERRRLWLTYTVV
jgi:hypothetical protein